MFGQQDLPVTILPEDFRDSFAESVYLCLTLVPDEVREGNMEGFMAQDFEVLLCAEPCVHFYQRVVRVLMRLTPRPLVAELAIHNSGNALCHR